MAWSPRFGVWMQGMRKEFGMTTKYGQNMEGCRGGISESIVEMTGRVADQSRQSLKIMWVDGCALGGFHVDMHDGD